MGVTLYPSYIVTGQIPECANFVFIYEKTMPNQGGRSLVDNGLGDSGQVLAHEIGHALVSLSVPFTDEQMKLVASTSGWQCM
jgi:hypothetical protein